MIFFSYLTGHTFIKQGLHFICLPKKCCIKVYGQDLTCRCSLGICNKRLTLKVIANLGQNLIPGVRGCTYTAEQLLETIPAGVYLFFQPITRIERKVRVVSKVAVQSPVFTSQNCTFSGPARRKGRQCVFLTSAFSFFQVPLTRNYWSLTSPWSFSYPNLQSRCPL